MSSKSRYTRSHSGCWTCRNRRVKCDEQRPQCRRCLQSALACEGFGVRLLRAEKRDARLDSRENPRLRTSDQLPLSGHALSPPTSLEHKSDMPSLNLAFLGEIPPFDCDLFSVFSVGHPKASFASNPFATTDEQSPPTVHFNSDSGNSSEALDVASRVAQNDFSDAHSHEESQAINDDGLHFEAPDEASNVLWNTFTGLTWPEEVYDQRYVNESAISERSTMSEKPQQPRPESLLEPQQRCSEEKINCETRNHLNLLSMPARQKRLIHHFVTSLSSRLMLIDRPDNPCRTVWLPVALAGLLSNSSHSGPGIALFHAVCALAAYNLAELGSGPGDEDLTLAIKHDYLAITHLQHSLDGSTTGNELEVSLAVMACISMEAVSAVPRRWRNCMAKGLKHFQRLLTRQSVSEELLQMAWDMTSMAVLSNVMISDEITTDAKNDESFHVANVSGGISPRAIRNLAEINQMHKSRNRYGEKEVDAFELKLYLDFPSSKSAYTETTEALILQHMDRAFYYAELVHFQRTVKGASLDTLETHIDHGLKELEAIQKVSHGSAGSIILWPILVLGSACNIPGLRNRTNDCFNQQANFGFRNVTVLHELVQIVWSRCDNAAITSDISWQQVIQEESYDVLRL